MKALLICPEHRPCGGAFHRMKPLALMPVMSRSLLDHALSKLKKHGFSEVIILATDRPELIRQAVGKGQAWGLKVEVIATRLELTAEAAEIEHGQWLLGESRPEVIILDKMPGMPSKALWQSHFSTFEAMRLATQDAELAAQLTMQQVSPDIWISTKARISPKAEITGPAWIGSHASVKAGAKVGPHAIVESGAFLDSRAEVQDSWIGPDTYVGENATIRSSFAWGDGLLNWADGSFLEVRDYFLLNDLSSRRAASRACSHFERGLALLLLLISLPMALFVMLRSRLLGRIVFEEKRVILPPPFDSDAFSRTHPLLRLSGTTDLLQRWPELWKVVMGDMALVGNRPLSPEEITALRGPVGQLWLESPAGVFSLADAEGADVDSIAESLAHTAYFTVKQTRALRFRILWRCLGCFLLMTKPITNFSSPAPVTSL